MAKKDLDDWLWEIGSQLQQLSGEMSQTPPKFAKGKAWQPHIDVYETEENIVIKAEIAGVQKENLHIFYNPENNSLTLRGIRYEEYEESEPLHCCHHLEVYYGEFAREIPLPNIPLVLEKTKAVYRNGFLTVYIPKDKKKIQSIHIQKIYTIQE